MVGTRDWLYFKISQDSCERSKADWIWAGQRFPAWDYLFVKQTLPVAEVPVKPRISLRVQADLPFSRIDKWR